MTRVFRFLGESFSKETDAINRLFVSSFLETNDVALTQNSFLKSYQIHSDDPDYEALKEFREILIKENIHLDFENIIRFFEFVISPEDRVVTGAVYTPEQIRKYIIEETFDRTGVTSQMLIADMSCGCGGFLFDAAKQIKEKTGKRFKEIFNDNIFGLDIQSYSIERTKILLTLLAVTEGEDEKKFQFNLFSGDALSFNWHEAIKDYAGFDVVLGNPPYVCSRNISEHTRALLPNWSVCSTGHPDLYIPFFQIGIENLKPDGVLGFITMNSFFKSVNGRALRAYFQEKALCMKIIDFGNIQVFRTKSTYTCICIIQNKEDTGIDFCKSNTLDNLKSISHFFRLEYKNIDSYRGWNLSQEAAIINKIETTGKKLGERYKTRNGIATLKNDAYIFVPHRETTRYFYLNDGDTEYAIEKQICRDVVNPNILASAKNLTGKIEKIIFPYTIKKGAAEAIEEGAFKKLYPRAYSYLLSKKSVLATRDKGKGKKYKPWFMFGRNQSLEPLKYKLFFPHISPGTPNFVIDTNENLLFYNGIAVIGNTKRELQILKKLMSSRLFWFYIKHTSKPYSSQYYSLSKNYIKNIGIADFSREEENRLLSETDEVLLNAFIEKKYGVNLSGKV